jgi:hypothetical protein
MCNCSSGISNCNCNDCSTITLPSIPGPEGTQGPEGPQGPPGNNGTDGLDAGNVIDTATSFTAQPVEPGAILAYSPSVLVTSASEFTKNEDRVKVRAIFSLADGSYTPGSLGVYINSIPNQRVNAVTLAEFSGTVPSQCYFFIEFYFDRMDFNLFNAVGTAKFTYDRTEIGTGLFQVEQIPSEAIPHHNYIINRQNVPTTVPLNNNLYVFLGSSDTSYISPAYFTVEYILRKP